MEGDIIFQGGKKVLIKLVMHVIPTYAMSCFIIADSIVKEIEAAYARFWWGSTEVYGGVHCRK